MQQLFHIVFTTSFAFAILRISTPIILAGMAAVISERAGVVNIAIEGMMLTGALTGVVVSAFTGSWVTGLLGSILVSMLISFILAYFTLNLKANIIMCGLAINIMAKGGTVFVLYLLTGNKGASTGLKSYRVPDIDVPVLKDIPVLGDIFSGHNLLTYLSIVIVFFLHIFMFRSKMGMRIRAVGENPDAVKSVGISVKRVQYYALLLSGFFSGIAGAFMSMGYMNGFTANMVSGRGFIALAANSMGQNTPWGTFFASLIFGCADAASNSLQVLRVPTQFIQMIPYITTILGITIYSVSTANKVKKMRMKLASGETQTS
jgi:simple sugar transport system permease protein